MTTLLPALLGAMILAGLVGAVYALRPRVPAPKVERVPSSLERRLSGMSPRSRIVLLVSVVAGFLVALLTGWIAAVVILPTAALGLPYLLAAYDHATAAGAWRPAPANATCKTPLPAGCAAPIATLRRGWICSIGGGSS